MTEIEQPADGSDAPEPAPPTTKYRLSDTERTTAITALGEAYAQGRLDADEFGARMSAATQAKLASDMTPLFADLPHEEPPFLVSLRTGPAAPAASPARADVSRQDLRRAARAHRASRPGSNQVEHVPHPLMFAPLIVLIIAATNTWFFLPLIFISLSMANRSAQHRRSLPRPPGAGFPHPPRDRS